MSFIKRSLSQFFVWSGLIITMSLGQVIVVQAQQLEEIIVTAQRREQSVQDVPMSLQAFQGSDMTRQGFDTLENLTTFAPGLIIKAGSEEQGLILRGAGTQSKNLGIEQGVPTFVDGIHMGRGSMVLSSYMDVERVEVLKGPQPVFFGQNAAGGALNIEARKPTDEWEAHLTAEVGNAGKTVVEGAFGGPITDTFAIRVAAKQYRLEGFMRDYFTGDKFPERKYQTVRLSTLWTPTENFTAGWKIEFADNDLGPRTNPIAFDKFAFTGPDLKHALRMPLTGILSHNIPPVDQQIGEFTNLGYRNGPTYINPRVESELGVLAGYPILTEASGSDAGMVLDFTTCHREGGLKIFEKGGIAPVQSRLDKCDFSDRSWSKPWHAIQDLTYTFANGVELTSKTGYSRQQFHNSPFNSGGGAIHSNARFRGEFFGQWSEEIRLTSPAGGELEWMTGVYWQRNNLDAWSDAYRSNSRNPIRSTRTHEIATWKSIFVAATMNFGDQLSVDVGARYTDILKNGEGKNRSGEWYVTNPNTGAAVRLPYGMDKTDKGSRDVATEAFFAANPWLHNASVVGRSKITYDCTALLGKTDPSGKLSSKSCVYIQNTIDTNSFDPQIVLRYRPDDDVSYYLKYATSFKAGGFDMGVSQVPSKAADFVFGPENYEILEAGMRGNFMNGRAQLEATVFLTDITGNQVSFVDRTSGVDRNVTQNVGAQKSDGIELSGKFAASDRLTLGAYVAFLDGTILDFKTSICTDDDRVAKRCKNAAGEVSSKGAADRTGYESRNSPDWQFTGNINYDLPSIIPGIVSNIDVTVVGSDDYTTDRSFSNVIGWDQSTDMNVSLLFGAEDDAWNVLLYARNLMENKPAYRAENDYTGEGLIESSGQVSQSMFMSYGARVQYNFF